MNGSADTPCMKPIYHENETANNMLGDAEVQQNLINQVFLDVKQFHTHHLINNKIIIPYNFIPALYPL